MELNRTSLPRPRSHLKSRKVQEIGLAECFWFIIYIWKKKQLLNIEMILSWERRNNFFSFFFFSPCKPPQTDSFVDGPEMRLSFLQIAALSDTKKKIKSNFRRRQKCAEVRVSVDVCMFGRWNEPFGHGTWWSLRGDSVSSDFRLIGGRFQLQIGSSCLLHLLFIVICCTAATKISHCDFASHKKK